MSGDVAGMLVVGVCTLAGFGVGALLPGRAHRSSPTDGPRSFVPSATRDAAVIDAVIEFVRVFGECAELAERGRAAAADYRGNASFRAHVDELGPRLDSAHARVQVLCRAQTLPVARQGADLAHSALELITAAAHGGSGGSIEALAAAIRGHRSALLEAVRVDVGPGRGPDTAPHAAATTTEPVITSRPEPNA